MGRLKMFSVKNFFWKFVVKMFPKKPVRAATPTRILVVSTTALGDTLWAMPGLESLRHSFPKAYIGVLTSRIGVEVFKENPWTDQIFQLAPFFSLWRTLKKGRFDTILLFHASQRSIVPLLKILSPQRLIGTLGLNKGLDSLLTDPLLPSFQHEIDRRLAMVEKIGGKIGKKNLSFFLSPEEMKKVARDKLAVALHPGANDSYKFWPVEHFAQVGRALQEEWGCDLFITGGPSESLLMEKLSQLIPHSIVVDSKGSLRSFASFLNGIDLLICNDSGPFHLACALNRPAIGLYSPTDPLLCGPLPPSSGTALFKKRSCTPCLKRGCNEPFCLMQIGVEEVVKEARSKLFRP